MQGPNAERTPSFQFIYCSSDTTPHIEQRGESMYCIICLPFGRLMYPYTIFSQKQFTVMKVIKSLLFVAESLFQSLVGQTGIKISPRTLDTMRIGNKLTEHF